MISIRILVFLRRKKGITRLKGWPQGSRACPTPEACPPALSPPWASSRVDSTSQNSHIFQKNIRKFLSHLNFVWYGFSAKQKTCNKQELALDQYVSPKNSIKSCQKYIKVVEYWHGTSKNYRYDGDVSGTWMLILVPTYSTKIFIGQTA